MKFAKITALVLVAVMLLATLAGCSSAYKNPEKYVNVPDLSTLKISQKEIDDYLKEQVDSLCTNNKKRNFDEVEDGIRKGDEITATFEGTLSDKSLDSSAFSILKGTSTKFVIGENATVNKNFPSDFESKLLGLKANKYNVDEDSSSEYHLTCKFENDFSNESLRGKEVVYKISIEKVGRLSTDKDSTLTVSYVPVDPTDLEAMEAIRDIIVELPEKKNDSEKSDADDTNTAVTTAAAAEEEKPVEFGDLFTKGTLTLKFEEKDDEINFTSDSTSSFSTIFKTKDLPASLFLEKEMLYKFAVAMVVPEDIKSTNAKYEEYAEKTVYFTFEITDSKNVPEWTDSLADEISGGTYKTTKEYEDYLLTSKKEDLSYNELLSASEVIKYPHKELQENYEDYLESNILNCIGSGSGSLSSYSKSEIMDLLEEYIASNKEYYTGTTTLVSAEDYYESLEVSSKLSAQKLVKERLVGETIIARLGIKLSSKEYKEKLKETYDSNLAYYTYIYTLYGLSEADAELNAINSIGTLEQFESLNGKSNLEYQFKLEMAKKLLPEKVTVND